VFLFYFFAGGDWGLRKFAATLLLGVSVCFAPPSPSPSYLISDRVRLTGTKENRGSLL